jgi:hypothetical protein
MAETGFRVAKDGVNKQSYTPPVNAAAYVDITWPTVIETDTTGGFDFSTGKWTAPASGVFITGWQVWNQAGVGYGGGVTAKCIKNAGGALDTAAIGSLGFYPNTGNQSGTMRYRVVAGDVFKIGNYCWPMPVVSPETTPPQITIDARSEHTYWWGSFVAD